MKKELNKSFLKLKNILKISLMMFFLSILFAPKLNLKAQTEYEITFHVNAYESYSLTYAEGDNISHIPDVLDFVFTGWYSNDNFTGDNYFNYLVDSAVPLDLYAKSYEKLDPAIYNALTVGDYNDGYELVSYFGSASYLYIPEYYYVETAVDDFYEVKDIIKINENAFLDNETIYTIFIPKTVTTIDEGAFNLLDALSFIQVDELNLDFSSDSYGVLYNKAQTEIICYPNASYNIKYKTLETLKIIKENNFSNALYLEEVVIKDSVEIIESEAFTNNVNLLRVIVEGSNLLEIEANAFKDNSNLIMVMIPSSVTYVGVNAFGGSSGLLDIYYQNKIVDIPLSWEADWNFDNFNIIEEYNLLTYTVTFLDYDNSVIATELVYFGNDATLIEDPTREGNLEFSYVFGGWSGNYQYIISDVTLTATYYETLNYYTVTFYDGEGLVYGQRSFPYGENENNNYWFTDVKKEKDAEYTYTFSHWNPDLTFISGDVDAYPVFNQVKNKYAVTFYRHDGNIFSYNYVEYGTVVEAPTTYPTKPATPQYTYIFAGWFIDEDLTIPYVETGIVETLNIYPMFNEQIRYYQVVFFNEGSLYETQSVPYGFDATAPVTPAKPSSQQYDYIFSGWSGSITNITAATVVHAQYTSVLRSYIVNFYNEEVLISSQQIPYEGAASAPLDPVKAGDLQYSYEFIGWNVSFNNITGNLNVYALYKQVLNKYKVTFYDEDGLVVLKEELVSYGFSATAPNPPLKAPTEGLVFTFNGWDKDYSNITTELDIYPTYVSSVREYTVRFYNCEILLLSQSIPYEGEAVAPLDPVKAPTAECSYEFIGWDKEFSNIKSDLDVYALFLETANSYTINFNSLGGSSVSDIVYKYNEEIVLPVNPVRLGYVFTGWYLEMDLNRKLNFSLMPAADLTLYAGWSLVNYSITYLNTFDLTNLNVTSYNILTDEIIFSDLGNRESHLFAGWYSDSNYTTLATNILAGSTGDITLYAKWELKEYFVSFLDYDNSVISIEKVSHGASATAPIDPVRVGYTFVGWDKEIILILGDLTVMALYEINTYEVTFNSLGGSAVDKVMVNYNSLIIEPNIPLKTGYSFSGWYLSIELINIWNFNEDLMPANNIILYASWTANEYQISFNSNGGSFVAPIVKAYEEVILKPTDPTRVGYNFSGWFSDANLTTLYIFTTMPFCNITLYASWEIKEYTVEFYNEDLTYLGSIIVNHGDDGVFPNPEKPATLKYNYIFSGWSESIINITSDLVLYATYSSVIRSYIVNFYADEQSASDNVVIKFITVNYDSKAIPPNAPSKDSTAEFHFTFLEWDKDFSSITSNLDVYPIYQKTLRKYNVTFYQDDLVTILSQTEVYYGFSATAPIDPIKAPTNRNYYEFAGWDLDFSFINGHLNVYATYNSFLRLYDVKFFNEGVLIKVDSVPYGTAATPPMAPSKASTPQYHYIFNGWDKGFSFIVGDLDVNARYLEELREYTVYFYDDDRGTLLGSKTVNYLEDATPDFTPSKIATPQYEYSFTGWDKDVTSVDKEMVVYAIYLANVRSYFVTFYDDDGSTILKEPQAVLYGQAAIPPANPIKESDEQYTYTFTHWNMDFSYVEGNLLVYATYARTLNVYKVYFYLEDVLYTEVSVNYGQEVILPVNPTKESDEQYVYVFAGWYLDSELLFDSKKPIISNHNVYGKFTKSLKTFTVNFYTEGQLHNTQQITYNEAATTPIIPSKAATQLYNYIFIGWDKDYTKVKENLMINAIYEEVLRTYLVNFYNETTLLLSLEVTAGTAATAPSDPTKPSTKEFHFEFIGWDKEFDVILSNLTLYAKYNNILREYTVYFYNSENTVIKEDIVYYGSGANAPEGPFKPATPKYQYEFIGWNKGFIHVYEDLHIYPLYKENLRSYTVKFYNEGKLLSKELVAYGSSATAPANPTKPNINQYSYTFTNWSEEFSNVTGDLNIYAVFSETLRTFTVTFYADENLVLKLSEQTVIYGEDALAPSDPLKEASNEYFYEFIGWNKEFTNVKDNLIIIALYEKTTRLYIVNFYSEGVLIFMQNVGFAQPATPTIIPKKAETDKYTYTFIGWDKNIDLIVEDTDVEALFREDIKSFTVTFYSDDKITIISRQTINYGSDANTPNTPHKASTEMYDFTFTSWDKEYSNITGHLNVYAKFSQALRSYTVKFYNDDNSLINEEVVLYGFSATAPVDPTKLKTKEFSYIFTGWDKEFNNITGNLNVYAKYERVTNSYIVIFYDATDEVIYEEVLVYGSTIVPPVSPPKEADEQYTYVFSHWQGFISGMRVTGDISFKPIYESETLIFEVMIIANKQTYLFNLPYGSSFPDVNLYMPKTDKYTYLATSATTSEGVILEEIPIVVSGNLTLTINYTAYINKAYFTNYLSEINFNSIRSYSSLVEAYLMLEEVKEEEYDELLALFNLSVNEYNILVTLIEDELEEVKTYEQKIFKGLLAINLSMQILSYALYFGSRRWF